MARDLAGFRPYSTRIHTWKNRSYLSSRLSVARSSKDVSCSTATCSTLLFCSDANQAKRRASASGISIGQLEHGRHRFLKRSCHDTDRKHPCNHRLRPAG
jgi:hypothetical protein